VVDPLGREEGSTARRTVIYDVVASRASVITSCILPFQDSRRRQQFQLDPGKESGFSRREDVHRVNQDLRRGSPRTRTACDSIPNP
jgi:hypothetical protein